MWEISVNSQILTFLYSLAFGAVLSLFFDIISTAAVTVSKSRAALFISDIFFWALSAFAVFIFLISRTNGEIRGYVLFSCAIGFMLYRATLRRIIFPVLKLLFSLVRRGYLKTASLLARFCDGFEQISGGITAKLKEILREVLKRVKKLLKSVFGMLYTDKNSKRPENDVDE